MAKLFISMIVVLMLAAGVLAQEQTGRVLDTINVRIGPGTQNTAITRIPVNSTVVVEARNRRGDWILIRTQDGSLRGWVASRYVYWENGIALQDLSVSTETVGAPAVVAVPVAAEEGGSAPTVDFATGDISTDGLSPRAAELIQILSNVPVLPTISPRARELYAQNIAQGRNPTTFAKVGDCNSENNSFMAVFGRGNYDLGPYSNLQSTIDYYSSSYNSFTRVSMSARTGHLATTVIDPIYADTVKCPGMSMLHCEYHQMNSAVSLITFGMADSFLMDVNTFRAAMNQIAMDSMNLAVLPIFFTVPANQEPGNDNFEKTMEFNLVIVEVANAHGLPVVNLWLAGQSIPGKAATADRIHPTSNDSFSGYFTGYERQLGFTAWNLLALQVLDMLRS